MIREVVRKMLGTRDSLEYADKDRVKQGERLGIYGIIVINLNDINLAYVRLIVLMFPDHSKL